MAKKTKKTTTTSTTDWWGVVKFCAYVTMVVAALAAMLSFVFGLVARVVDVSWAGRVTGICSMIAQVSLLVAVIIPAYKFMRTKNAVVRAFFWVAVIFLVLGLVGLNLAF